MPPIRAAENGQIIFSGNLFIDGIAEDPCCHNNKKT